MRDDVAEPPVAEDVLHPAEADRRKVVLSRLRNELAAHGINSVLVGRRVLRLNAAGPRSRSGPVDPELHIDSAGCRVTTDGRRYQFTDGTVYVADDLAGAAGHVFTAGARDDDGCAQPAQAAGDGSAAPTRVIGPGEQALRQLIDDGII